MKRVDELDWDQKQRLIELRNRLKLIEDDLVVAYKTKNNLIQSNEKLDEAIEQDRQKLEELSREQIESEEEDHTEPVKNDGSSQYSENGDLATFFQYLAQIESREIRLKEEIEQTRKRIREVKKDKHYQNIKKDELKAELEKIQEAFRDESDRQRLAETEYVSLSEKGMKLDDQVQELQSAADDLRSVLEEKNAQITERDIPAIHEAQQRKCDLEKNIKVLLEKLEELEAEFEREKRKHQKDIDQSESELARVHKVSSWMNDRSILIEKIRRAKANIERKQQSINKEKELKEKLISKFKQMFGESDPGDGTGPMARMIAYAEAESYSQSEDKSKEIEFEIMIEKEYEAQLDASLKQIQDSIKAVTEHRDEIMKLLETEYKQCSTGYLTLLAREKDEIASGVNTR